MSKVFCRVDNCKKRHRMLLHPVNDNNNSSSNDATIEPSKPSKPSN